MTKLASIRALREAKHANKTKPKVTLEKLLAFEAKEADREKRAALSNTCLTSSDAQQSNKPGFDKRA